MSYQEKRTIVSITTALIILVIYFIYAYGRYQTGTIASDDLKAWAGIILIFIAIEVFSVIIIQIIFHILLSISIAIKENIRTGKCDDKEIEKTINAQMLTDEMDKLIELKSMKVGFFIVGIGFVTALATQLLNYPSAVLLNIIFLSFNIGGLFEGFTQIYYYRRGIRNG